MNQVVIDVRHLRKSFNERVVIHDLALHVNRGEVFGFLGPNGSGKTTTIRMLCGLLTPDAGEGTCLGYNILTESEKIKAHMGYMTQKFSFYTDLSIEENLKFIARVYNLTHKKARIERALEELGLVHKRHQLTGELSGGWKQRVALAACLLHEPELLLLDEPTAGVDPMARREFWDKIHSLSEQGITTLVSTHYMDEAERCTSLAYLSDGNLLISGRVKDVINKAGLSTWEISGEVTTALLKRTKTLEGVTQAALFGNKIHISGYNSLTIEAELHRLAEQCSIHFQRIDSTLEDAFISFGKTTGGETN